VKCDIGFLILIQMTLTFLLDFENALMLKHNINSLMPFPHFFRLILKTHYYRNATSILWSRFRIIFRWISFQQKDKRCQWMWEDEFYFHPSISHPQHWWLILQWRYRLLNISNSKFGQYSLSQEFQFLASNFKFKLARYFVFWTLWHSFWF
jgi:hypothetical protein